MYITETTVILSLNTKHNITELATFLTRTAVYMILIRHAGTNKIILVICLAPQLANYKNKNDNRFTALCPGLPG